MKYAMVKDGVVLEVYYYSGQREMEEKNHPDFYPYMIPCPEGVRRGWAYDQETGSFTEPELYSLVEALNEQYLPTDQQRINLLEEKAKLLEAQNQVLANQNEFLEECIAEMAMIVYL